jgi:glycosyltransferase involved in cell wall biosynthesis
MPELSIIVCTYNREKYIKKTLRYLNEQSIHPRAYEVLIIDNNSTDDTAKICKDFISGGDLDHFHYFLEMNQGHTYARNRGIKESNGEYIAFLDDDAWVYSNYCENIIHYFNANPEVVALGGKITPVYEGQPPPWMTKYLWPLVAGLDMGDDIREFKHAKYPIGANMAFRATVFKDYGYFNTDLGRRGTELEGGDEKDMVYRLKKDGRKVHYVPSIHVKHIIPESRTQMSYIKGQAIGVGTSEKKRLLTEGISAKIKKTLEEIVKIGGTCVLALFYLLTFKAEKGLMLIKFRMWVIQGYFLKIRK